ncbi:hypothetical protein GA0070558_1259 [Micromonospora haikouensis]|uniref:Uncharacterized protein n=1 Tax=Micromonospora haikouensis TaxID=686309 RepID=A0A1C4XGA7_9ACTN|nr:hypothetical protein GA0070558_1259 [Micromonospora haikouensis]
MTVFRPVRSPRASGRIEVVELPPADLAVTVHQGSHDDIDVTYGRLGGPTRHSLIGRRREPAAVRRLRDRAVAGAGGHLTLAMAFLPRLRSCSDLGPPNLP